MPREFPASASKSNPRAIAIVLGAFALVGTSCAHSTGKSGQSPPAPASSDAAPTRARSCFLLHELGVGRVVREPSEGCAFRVPPASTFKVPHALAALDAGVLEADEVFPYDGKAWHHGSYRRDQPLASAIRYSVLWYFQRLAERLGPERELDYLERFNYGNTDISSGLTSFWLYESLRISPDEQAGFLVRLYEHSLPIKPEAQEVVRGALVQPAGKVVNATGEHPFAQPWPEDAVVSAKTGSGSRPNEPDVRWLVGHVRRGHRAWIFVANVVGDGLSPLAALDLAGRSLKAAGVL